MPKQAYQNRYRSDPEPEMTTETSDEGTATADTPDTSPDTSPKVDWEKRYGDLQSYTTKLQTENKTKIDALTEQLNGLTRKSVNLPKSNEEIEAWRKQFPEIYDAVITIAHMAAAEEKKPLVEDIEKLKNTKKELEQETAVAKVVAAHKDFYQLRLDENLRPWAATQPRWVWMALYDEDDWDPDACIDAIDKYKTHLAKQQRKEKRVDATAAENVKVRQGGAPNVDGSGKRIYTLSEIGKLKPHEYLALEADIDLARKEGRIVQA